MPPTPNTSNPGDELEVLVETAQEDGGVSFVGETLYQGWSSLSVVRPLDAAAGSFSLEVTDRRPWPLRPGAPVRIRLAGEEIVRGFVDTFEGSSSSRGRRIRISGRDRTADLVDCSATNDPGEWTGLDLLAIARELATPFGVEIVEGVAASGSDLPEILRKPFPTFKLQPGETAWSALERALRARALLGYTDGAGTLILTRPGELRSSVPLVEGPKGNVLASRFMWTSRDRFQTYIVRNQGTGSDDGWGDQVSEIEGLAEDGSVDRFRPWLVLGESSMTFSSAADRAQWEAAVRAARAQTLEIDVQGWRRELFGTVWKVNELVDVKIPSLGIQTDMLVNRVQFKRDARAGTTTKLQLIRKDAYLPKPEVPEEGPLDETLTQEEWSEQ